LNSLNKQKLEVSTKLFSPGENPEYDNYNQWNEPVLLSNLKKKRLDQLSDNLEKCGMKANIHAFCKACLDHGKTTDQSYLGFKETRIHCQIRYCDKCNVVVFRRRLEDLNNITRFEDLKTLMHCVFGFESMTIYYFKKNFKPLRKRYNEIFNRWISRLRNLGYKLDGFRVLDLSFKTKDMIYPHFHICFAPVSKQVRRKFLTDCQAVRSSIISNARNKTKFHFQFFKHAEKKAVFSYLALRSAGLYKWKEVKDLEYIPEYEEGILAKKIKNGEFMLLKDIFSKEEYMDLFYQMRNFMTFGKVKIPTSHGSNSVDNLVFKCNDHGERKGNQLKIIIEYLLEDVKPPPDVEFPLTNYQKECLVLIETTKGTPKHEEIKHNLKRSNQLWAQDVVNKILEEENAHEKVPTGTFSKELGQ